MKERWYSITYIIILQCVTVCVCVCWYLFYQHYLSTQLIDMTTCYYKVLPLLYEGVKVKVQTIECMFLLYFQCY